MVDLSVGNASSGVNKLDLKNDGKSVDPALESNDLFAMAFPDKSNSVEQSGNDPTKSGNVNATPQADTAQKPKEPAFKSDIPAFDNVNLKDDATPQKVVNGINIYSTGSKEKINVTNMNNITRISIGDAGQKIDIPSGQMQSSGATIVYNGKTLALKGLNGATITGLRDNENHKQYVNNQITAKDCPNCTFDMNDKSNGSSESRDDLVLDNCKSANIKTGQNNAIVALNGTSGTVSYNTIGGKAVEDNPLKDWVNTMPTNIAYDDSSSLKMGNRGTINREKNHNMIHDLVKKQGATEEDNSYKLENGKSMSAHEFLLDTINKDAKDSNNASKSMFSPDREVKMPKLSTKGFISQLKQINNNYKSEDPVD